MLPMLYLAASLQIAPLLGLQRPCEELLIQRLPSCYFCEIQAPSLCCSVDRSRLLAH